MEVRLSQIITRNGKSQKKHFKVRLLYIALGFNIQKLSLLPTGYIYMFWIDLTANSNYYTTLSDLFVWERWRVFTAR